MTVNRTLLCLICASFWFFQSLSGTQAQGVPAAQRPVNPTGEIVSDGQRIADSLLPPLDKSRILTGILYDRVPTLARLDVFDPADTSDYIHFRQAPQHSL